MRWVWDYNEKYLKDNKKNRFGFLLRFVFNYLRVWDRLAADRPDFLIANSRYTQKRITKYYRRESEIIYPPINTSLVISHQSLKNKNDDMLPITDYFLVVSRLSAYKKVDVIVESFNKLGLPLVVIGTGEQEKYLKKIAKENIKIIGWQNDDVTQAYFQNARAFIFAAEDDFGITPVEAMQCGVPVISFRAGGAMETIKEGITGEFFDAQTPEVLADGIRRFLDNEKKYSKEVIKKSGEEFSSERFRREFKKFVDEKMGI
jgi:glycosyltransferase involved in cell wall biosynthesis